MQARQAWIAERFRLPLRRLVFLDETWASTNMTPIRGRAPKGVRCSGRTPYGHWRTTTFICALRTQGLIAPLVLDGPINGRTFMAWVEQMLVPELRPADIVVMDNLGSHKVAGIQKAIEAAGAQVCYLPPYSPDLNPIEQVFSKIKNALRKTSARTVGALWSAFGKVLDHFADGEYERFMRHCGYGQLG